ncbi:intraflagellar transport protein 52 homolog [Caerostris extrusa]|uniref:Intraflagellar transport protein 52 homolog n=1 Tax=Caerostris extrusa TaxID=172846 RepID=A0AAV4QBV3_CAEEX|nr:intraflagellar transport protein 52 homolog [Caerostris extrusa]
MSGWPRGLRCQTQGLPYPAARLSILVHEYGRGFFPPSFRELQKPTLELFDLDEAFSTEKARLAQLTNKCADEDIEYFIRECGDVLNVIDKLPSDKRDGKHILEYIVSQVAEFKKLNQASME